LVKSTNTTKQVCAFQRFQVSFQPTLTMLKIRLTPTETVLDFHDRFSITRCVWCL